MGKASCGTEKIRTRTRLTYEGVWRIIQSTYRNGWYFGDEGDIVCLLFIHRSISSSGTRRCWS